MEGYNLLATSTIEMAVVYRSDFSYTSSLLVLRQSSVLFVCLWCFRDVQERGLSRSTCLSESDQWDAVLSALVIDLDFDGQKEVLLGTYGQVRASLYLSLLKLHL